MKILVFGETYFNYTDSTVVALKMLGHDVCVVHMPLLHKSELSLFEHLKYKLKDKKFINQFYNKCSLELVNILNDFKPDIFLSINGNIYWEFVNAYVLNKAKEVGTITVLWFVDTIKYYIHREQNLDKFDYVYSFEPNDIEWAKEKFDIVVKYLPLGVAEEIYCGFNEGTEKIYDLCFVGNKSENRLEILNEIAKYCDTNNKKMVVYGHYWHNKHWWQEGSAKRKFAQKYPILIKYIKNQLLKGEEVAKLYLQSKICLNIHVSLHKGINPRTFEILGNGNFELCDYRNDAKEFGLIDKENLAMYTDADDCIRQIEYYLNHEEERKVIGVCGKKIVKDKYTITKLLNKLLHEVNMKG